MDWTAIVAEHKIQEAMEAGEFRNVPGAGQPLDDSVLSTSVFDRFTNRLMKQSGALPAWLELQREIERETKGMGPYRQRALDSIRRTRNAATRLRIAHRLRTEHRDRMDIVNTMVLKYNMDAPASLPRLFRTFKIKDEIETLENEIEASMDAANLAESHKR